MRLDEAIAGGEDLLVDDPHFDPELRRAAVKLLIEAGKYLRYLDTCPGGSARLPLPGETEK